MSALHDLPAAGWRAELQLGFGHDGRRTVLTRRQHTGPLVIQKPFYPEGGPCHVYLLHPPGGVVGGDRLELGVRVDERAHALITTPAAAKFYRSAGATAHLEQTFHVADGAALEWLPQETILFADSRVAMQTTVNLEGHGRFIGWELLCLGRPASGEAYDVGRCRQRFALYRDGAPQVIDTARLDGAAPVLREAWGLQGASVTGTLLAGGADRDLLDRVRDIAPGDKTRFSATLINDVLVCRVLASQAEAARHTFIDVWSVIRPILLQRPACPPRIWST